jgi:1-acyl-sn-glycerol-3-phosphate acyltransferase
MTQATHAGPRKSTLLQRSALGLLRLLGWRSSFVWPPEPRGVIVVYPHTSNWDFIYGVLFRVGNGLPANWIGKAEMFKAPFRGLLERIGGIPLDRRKSVGFVDALLAEFRRRDWMWVAIAPEGTRSYTNHLKSGFYQLATQGDMPVAFGYIDYAAKTVGVDTYVRFSGDLERDMDTMRRFYADKRGHRPDLAGQVSFRR